MQLAAARDGAFTIAIDPIDGLIEVTMIGLWNADIFHEYEIALRREVRAMRARPVPPIRALFDARDLDVQSPQMIDRFKSMAQELDGALSRVALVITRALQKMQASRVSPAGRQGVFADIGDARAWLAEAPTS